MLAIGSPQPSCVLGQAGRWAFGYPRVLASIFSAGSDIDQTRRFPVRCGRIPVQSEFVIRVSLQHNAGPGAK